MLPRIADMGLKLRGFACLAAPVMKNPAFTKKTKMPDRMSTQYAPVVCDASDADGYSNLQTNVEEEIACELKPVCDAPR